MFVRLILLFTLVPLMELALLIELGRQIGLLNTIAVVIVTGVAGALLARSEGFSILARIQKELADGQPPGDSLVEGALILSGALLLLTPGIMTDAFGFALLLPITRPFFRNYLKKYFRRKLNKGEIEVNYKIEE